jgi:uncharacterized protein (TIGR02996 family)
MLSSLDHKPFIDNIEANIQDDAFKLIYADWLDEHNLPIHATVWRWFGTTGRYPGKIIRNKFGFGCETSMEDVVEYGGSQCCLPRTLFKATEQWFFTEYGSIKEHIRENSATEAVQVIIQKWEKATRKRWLFPSKQFIPSWDRVNLITPEEALYRIKLKFNY